MSDLPEITGSVLWLEPEQDSASYFRKQIIRLSEKYKSPAFNPHITLSRINNFPHEQVIQNLQEIAVHRSGFSMRTLSAECRDKPYQKIIVPLRTGTALTDLYNTIDKIFGDSFSKRTDPHLSLLYGNQPCRSLAETVEQINREKPDELYVQKISLITLNGSPEVWSKRFTVFLND